MLFIVYNNIKDYNKIRPWALVIAMSLILIIN